MADPIDWIAGNRYLGLTSMQHNAEVFRFYALQLIPGITYSAMAAMLGNMESESTINPAIWENLDPYEGGFGLVQWTPYTKYSEWYVEYWGPDDGSWQTGPYYEAQIDRIWYEANNNLQWFANPNAPIRNPPISLKEFLQSNLPPGTLANYFLWYYEHPKVTIQPNRAKQAEYWYTYLTGLIPPPSPKPKSDFKFIYYLKPYYKGGIF